MSLAWPVYRVLAPVLGALAPAAGVFASPNEQPFWKERMGASSYPGGCHAWIHAASLGEAAAVPPLVRELRAVQPGARVWLTATSRGGRAKLRQLERGVSLAPIDSPQAVRRFVDGIGPERLFLVETELWPHWLLRARSEGIPVAVVSARLSERSVGRYRGLGAGMRSLVHGLHAVLCQSEDDRRRWLEIGADPARVRVVGNLKSDGLPEPAPDRREARAAMGADPERRLFVLGSLRPGEGRQLARAWTALPAHVREGWQVIAVPRHLRASEELSAEVAEAGVVVSSDPARSDAWGWDDRTGVLVNWYRGADLAFVGGSLSAFGGHNPLEPAACGAAVAMGLHHESQRDYVRALREGDAIELLEGGPALAAALERLLADHAWRDGRAKRAREVAEAQRGSAARAVAALVEFELWPA
ncbi:MAG: glycosyltransferase N-terminal domain-containing protein [Candidatus Eisenbacteria bacterium]